ncbi:hypothetical protein [Herbaspirillum sp. ST 5-3]|uniref:hypothetical protein n=1 Tax=Oxalobacteraceae TaxID=75682 RepID=UPI0010A55811|nr:hypothetical protein [Herbaspirillum sp. ST 5-3]
MTMNCAVGSARRAFFPICQTHPGLPSAGTAGTCRTNPMSHFSVALMIPVLTAAFDESRAELLFDFIYQLVNNRKTEQAASRPKQGSPR